MELLANILPWVIILSMGAIFLGLFKPSIVKMKKRSKVIFVYGAIFFSSLILFGMVLNSNQELIGAPSLNTTKTTDSTCNPSSEISNDALTKDTVITIADTLLARVCTEEFDSFLNKLINIDEWDPDHYRMIEMHNKIQTFLFTNWWKVIENAEKKYIQ